MPSGLTSAMTTTAATVPAPPGVFATSMPLGLASASNPLTSTEDKESVTSSGGRRKRSMVNCGSTSLLQPQFSTSQFVIESAKASFNSSNRLRKNTKPNRARLLPSNGGSNPVNKPLKVTIRRTAARSHILDARPDGDGLSPSSVYSSVPGDDESSVISGGVSDKLVSGSKHQTVSPVVEKNKTLPPTQRSLDYVDEHPLSKRDASTSTADCGTITEPDLLGPCEPGSKITLEGVVWLETSGLMVINAQWRGRAYLGTLLDASKNTLGPSCPDKMISSLSMVRSRSNWGGTSSLSSNSYRSSVNCSTSGTGIPSNSSLGTIRTRSAIAASEDPTSQRRRALHPGGRGRKRRRGGMVPSSSTATSSVDDVTTTPGSLPDDQGAISRIQIPPAPEFACPQPGCEKRFSDILGVRFHLDMIHAQQHKTPEVPVITEDFVTIPPKRRQSLDPPQLAKVKLSGENSFTLESFDEDPPPPQLDRGAPADEIESSVIPMCEPPAASPAYSDISDDGPMPQKERPTPATPGNIGQQGWRPPVIPTVPQPQPIDWSGRHGGITMGKLPFEYKNPPSQVAPNGLPLSSYATGGSPYSHHRTSIHTNSAPVPMANDKIFQAHLVNFMAAGVNPSGCPSHLPPPPPPHSTSRQSPSQSRQLFRPQ